MTDQSTAYRLLTNPITAIILLVLLLFGIAYAAGVRWLRHTYPNHGYTAFLVAGGDLFIAIAYSAVAGLEAALLLLACMAAAGLPMIFEYGADHLNRQDSGKKLDI